MACYLSLAPLPSILSLAGKEHGRTIPKQTLVAQCSDYILGLSQRLFPCKHFDFSSVRAAMRRREFITLLGSAVAWAASANAQSTNQVRRIGFLRAAPPPEREVNAFFAALAEH